MVDLLKSLIKERIHPRKGGLSEKIGLLSEFRRLMQQPRLEANPYQSFNLERRSSYLWDLHHLKQTSKNRVAVKDQPGINKSLNDLFDLLTTSNQTNNVLLGNSFSELEELFGMFIIGQLVELGLKNNLFEPIKNYIEPLIIKSRIGIQLLFEKLAISSNKTQITNILQILSKANNLTLNKSRLENLEEALIFMKGKNKLVSQAIINLVENILSNSHGSFELTNEYPILIDIVNGLKYEAFESVLEKLSSIYPHPKLLEKSSNSLAISPNPGPDFCFEFLPLLSKFKFNSHKEIPENITKFLCNLIETKNPNLYIKAKIAKLKIMALLILFDLPNLNQEMKASLSRAYNITKNQDEKNLIKLVGIKHQIPFPDPSFEKISLDELSNTRYLPIEYLKEHQKELFILLFSRASLFKLINKNKSNIKILNQRLNLELDSIKHFDKTSNREEVRTKFYELLLDLAQNTLSQDGDDYSYLHTYIDPLIKAADSLLLKICLERCFKSIDNYHQEEDSGLIESLAINLLNYLCQFDELQTKFEIDYPSYFEDPEIRNKCNKLITTYSQDFYIESYRSCKQYLKAQLAAKF